MALFNWNRRNKTKVQGFAEQDNSGQWIQYFNQYMNSLNSDKLITYKEEISYELAGNVAEIFFPIDAIAERTASVEYKLYYEATGEEYTPKGNLERLIKQPNPFYNQAGLVYNMTFSELSDGNAYTYTKIPESLKYPTIDNISNIWVLKPNVTKPIIRKEVPNPFLIKDKAELIEYYKTFFLIKQELNPMYIHHTTSLGMDENCVGRSPLLRVERNINNILAVYHARYNVYAKNGNAGILTRAPQGANALSMSEALDPVSRDLILKDLQDRNGLTGNKNFIGISSIPLNFLKTMGTISELEPFEETESNAVTIAGLFGVDQELVPKRGSSTFTNKQQAETALWQNVVKGICEDRAKDLTKVYYLPDGVVFRPDFSKVEALQEDKKTALESDSILIDNLAKLTEAGQNMGQAYTNLTDIYNG